MMNNEDFERKMTFIVNQQAQFAVDIDKLRQAQAETVAAQTKTEETLTHLSAAQIETAVALKKAEDVVTRLAYVTNVGFKDTNAKIDALINSQIELQDSQKLTDEKFRQLLDRDRRNGSD
jgi:hypothetical protein